jgi:UDP-glucose 4-epimerase
MLERSIVISGISSFTGSWIAQAFALAGWQVRGLCSQKKSDYQGVRLTRLERIASLVELHFEIKAETGAMEKWISRHSPSLWLHHHHFMDGFRRPDYNWDKMSEICLNPLPSVVRALSNVECKGILYSGTYFEPGEGGERFATATPYGRSKAMVWKALERLASLYHIPLAKIVIPNPVGPLENSDRLIPVLLETSRGGDPFRLNSPNAVLDNVPVTKLAGEYVEAANRLLKGWRGVVRPSGWVGPAKLWVEKVRHELLEQTLHLPPFPLEIASEERETAGHQNPSTERRDYNWEEVWSNYRSVLDLSV